jgi:hypothetical protein
VTALLGSSDGAAAQPGSELCRSRGSRSLVPPRARIWAGAHRTLGAIAAIQRCTLHKRRYSVAGICPGRNGPGRRPAGPRLQRRRTLVRVAVQELTGCGIRVERLDLEGVRRSEVEAVLGPVGLVFVMGQPVFLPGHVQRSGSVQAIRKVVGQGVVTYRWGYRRAQSWPRTLYRIADARAALSSRKGSGRSGSSQSFHGSSAWPPVSHTPVSLSVREDTVLFLFRLLHASGSGVVASRAASVGLFRSGCARSALVPRRHS